MRGLGTKVKKKQSGKETIIQYSRVGSPIKPKALGGWRRHLQSMLAIMKIR